MATHQTQAHVLYSTGEWSPKWHETSPLLLNLSHATSLMCWYQVYKDNIQPSSSAPALPMLEWAQDEIYVTFQMCFLTSSLAVSQWLLVCQEVPIRNDKNPSTLTACIWVWLFFFFPLKIFLVFQYGVEASVPSSRKLIQPLTGFSVRSFRKHFQLEVFAWGVFLFTLSCAWHQLQVLFLFGMERILSSIPKGPFGFF